MYEVKWRRRKRYYPDVVMWERSAKQQLQRIIRLEGRARHKNHRHIKNQLYECLYAIIRSDIPETEKFPELQ